MADKLNLNLNSAERKVYDMLVQIGTSSSTRAQVERDRPSGRCELETGVSLCRLEGLSDSDFEEVINGLQNVLQKAYLCDEIYYTDARYRARPFDPVSPDRGEDGSFILEWSKTK